MCIVLYSQICSFRKKSIPTPWKVIENSFGEGVLTVNIFEAKYEAKLEFPRERGGGGGTKQQQQQQQQKPSVGGSMDSFWNCAVLYCSIPDETVMNCLFFSESFLASFKFIKESI